MTLCNDDVILTSLKHAVFTRKRETTEFIPPIPWPPNSPDLNPVVYSMWGTVQEVYKTCTTDLNDLKHRITEWAKLDHAVIAAAVYHHNGIVSQRASTLVALILNTVFWWRHCFYSDNCDLSCCCWPVKQLHANRPVWFNCSCQLTLCIATALYGGCLFHKVK